MNILRCSSKSCCICKSTTSGNHYVNGPRQKSADFNSHFTHEITSQIFFNDRLKFEFKRCTFFELVPRNFKSWQKSFTIQFMRLWSNHRRAIRVLAYIFPTRFTKRPLMLQDRGLVNFGEWVIVWLIISRSHIHGNYSRVFTKHNPYL